MKVFPFTLCLAFMFMLSCSSEDKTEEDTQTQIPTDIVVTEVVNENDFIRLPNEKAKDYVNRTCKAMGYENYEVIQEYSFGSKKDVIVVGTYNEDYYPVLYSLILKSQETQEYDFKKIPLPELEYFSFPQFQIVDMFFHDVDGRAGDELIVAIHITGKGGVIGGEDGMERYEYDDWEVAVFSYENETFIFIDEQTKKHNRVGSIEELKNNLANVTETGTFTDKRDGKVYKTIKIGDQVWMAENLAYKTESGSWAYENKEDNVAIYGRLYKQEYANSACPIGWHLPSEAEWTTLINYLGGKKLAGDKLKSKGDLWVSPYTNADNMSGFTALPAGCGPDSKGSFDLLSYNARFWSSTQKVEDSEGEPEGGIYYIVYDLYFDSGEVNKIYIDSKSGVSVRCIKN